MPIKKEDVGRKADIRNMLPGASDIFKWMDPHLVIQ